MRKLFKKIGFILLIASCILSVKLVTQKDCCANALTLGDTLLQPEDGWQRYDDENFNISYDANWQQYNNSPNVWAGGYHHNRNVNSNSIIVGATIKFEFYGTKLRIMTWMNNNITGGNVKIDGIDYGNYKSSKAVYGGCNLFFEKENLKPTLHKVQLTTVDKNTITPNVTANWFALDAIDIDKDGYLVPYSDDPIASSIVLNKDTANLKAGESDTLSVKVLPDNTSNKNVIWTSSDTSIATVDESGKITGVKEGKTTITVSTTDGTKLSDSCEVIVQKNYKVRAILTITMSNNLIKTYDLSSDELNSFLNWYDAKSKGIAPSYYVIENKVIGNNISNSDYISYDKIEYFNVQKYNE